MSDTTAAFVERRIRSKKNYSYMEDFGNKYIHKLPPFMLALNYRKSCLIDLKPKGVKNSEISSILYNKPPRDYRNQNLKLEKMFKSQSVIYHSEMVASQSLRKKFLKLKRLLPGNHLHAQFRMIRVRIYVASLIEES